MFDTEARTHIVRYYLCAAREDGLTSISAPTLLARNGFLAALLTPDEVADALRRISAEEGTLKPRTPETEYSFTDRMAGIRAPSRSRDSAGEFSRVLGENLLGIVERLPIGFVYAREQRAPDADPGWEVFRNRLSVGSKQYQRLTQLVHAWHTLRADPRGETANAFLSTLTDVFGLARRESLTVPGLPFAGVVCEMAVTRLAAPFRLNLYLVTSPDQLGPCVARISGDPPHEQEAILFLPELVDPLRQAHIPGRKLIRLWDGPMKVASASPDPGSALAAEVLKQADLGLLSPYRFHGPVSQHMFYGREKELALLVSQRDTSFAIYGPRRIGKTSLAHQLLSILKDRPEERALPAYVDCSVMNSSADVFARLSERLSLGWKRGDPWDDFTTAVAQVRAAKVPQGRVVLILDEIDRLIHMDETHGEFFWALRVLINEGVARVVVCGFRELRNVAHGLNHPVFNMFRSLHLGTLEMPAARGLVQNPMKALGISFSPNEDAVVGHLLEQTTTHPGTIQFFCDELLNRLNENDERVVTSAHVTAVGSSEAFESFVLCGLGGLGDDELWLLRLHPVATAAPLEQIVRNCSPVLTEARARAAFHILLDWMIVRPVESGSDRYVYTHEALPRVVRRLGDSVTAKVRAM